MSKQRLGLSVNIHGYNGTCIEEPRKHEDCGGAWIMISAPQGEVYIHGDEQFCMGIARACFKANEMLYRLRTHLPASGSSEQDEEESDEAA